nr:PKD domain-containing protein [Chitinophagaceae bacterium]
AYRWYWDFGDGNFGNTKNPKHKYATAGTFNVRYFVITDVGCFSDTVIKPLTVTIVPNAKFTVSLPSCVGKPVIFSDLSNAFAPGSLLKWYWDYGDGKKDTLNNNSNRSHVYAVTGNYNASLKVETNSGCQSALYVVPVSIHPIPVVNFSLPQVCLPAGTAQFFDSSKIADGSESLFKYLWNFGDAPSGALNTGVVKNPVHQYNNSGPFTIQLQVTSKDGCVADTTKLLTTIYPASTANFAVTPGNCLGDVTVFTDQASGNGYPIINWFWDFGDGLTSTAQNPTHNYLTANTYQVKHTIKTIKGCVSDTIIKQVVIDPLPAAGFNSTSPACDSKDVTFTNTSIANAGNIILWNWNLGDGTILSLNNGATFTHLYTTTGSYTVTLSVVTDRGCKSSLLSKQVLIHKLPVANFILPEICLNDAFAQFLDSSYIGDGTDSSFTYLWNFGDPGSGALNTSSVKHPKHKYNAVGNYNISLSVTSNNGCTTTVTKSFTVNGSIPVANFIVQNPGSLCSNTDVSIQNISSVNFGNVTRLEIFWDFSNNPAQTDIDENPTPNKIYSHLYSNFQSPLTKSFQVKMRSFSGGTCVNEIIKTVTINATPKVQFAPVPDACLNVAPYLINQASETGGVSGNGVFSGPGIVASGFFDPKVAGVGSHIIRYTFTSNKGCVDFKEQTINVLQPPDAKFDFVSPACENKAVTFNDLSSATIGSLKTWSWDFGDGSPVVVRNSGAAFTHTFTNAAVYNVKLTVTDNTGCNSTAFVKTVTINSLPVVDFSLPKICLPNAAAQFKDLSSISDGTATQFTYNWDFGDLNSGASNNTSTQKNPTHVYTALGPYNVTLAVTSAAGCTSLSTKSYNDIHPQPQAKFTSNTSEICEGGSITFTDQSTGADGTLQSWLWNFGDGSSSSLQNPPPHVFVSAATINVQLTATNSNGCMSNVYSYPVIIDVIPSVNAGPDRNVLEGGSIILSPTVTGNNLQYLWTPNQYLNNNTIKNPVVSGVEDKIYTLLATSRGGCSASDQVFVKVLKFPTIPNTFTPNNDGINDTWIIQYLETYPDNRVQVFNRYGQLVFESRGYAKPWDGTMNGKPLPFGTYYYIIEPANGRKPITGYVTIIK